MGDIIEAYVPTHFDGCPVCLLNEAVNCVVPTYSQRYWRISMFWAKFILEKLRSEDFEVKCEKRFT